jgi:hypothetical protein
MISTRTKAKAGAKAAKGIIQEPLLRSAVSEVGPPVAKLGMKVGKRRLNRRTRKQLEQLGDTVGSVATLAQTYVPQAAQAAQQLGLVEPPKTKRTTPRVFTGVALGATLMYLLEPGSGQQHRRQVRKLFGQAQSAVS